MPISEISREYNRTKNRERKRELHEQHRCTQCGGQDADTLAGRYCCKSCAIIHSCNASNRCDILKMQGRCAQCGKRDERTVSGKTLCDSCAERKNAAEKIVREERKSAGLCRDCGKPVEDLKYVRCSACRERQRDARRRRMFREVMES